MGSGDTTRHIPALVLTIALVLTVAPLALASTNASVEAQANAEAEASYNTSAEPSDENNETDEAGDQDEAGDEPPEDGARRHRPATAHDRAYQLTVHVVKRTDEGRDAAPGAKVMVYELDRHRDGYKAQPVARGTTDANGTASFQLASGAYGLRATDGDAHGHAKVRLHQDTRLVIPLSKQPERPMPHDRPAPHDGPYTLGVYVSKPSDKGPVAAADAKVLVYRMSREDGTAQAEPVARGMTDGHGKVAFDLPAGAYGIRAHHEAGDGHAKVRLHQDDRVRVHLAADDRRQPGPYNVGIAAGVATDEGYRPAAGAEVLIQRWHPAARADEALEPVARGTTDDKGHLTATLAPGIYKVTVTSEDGELEATKRIPVGHDRWVRMLLESHDENDQPHEAAIDASVDGQVATDRVLGHPNDAGHDDRPDHRPSDKGPNPRIVTWIRAHVSAWLGISS